MESLNLKPAPEADRRTLARRLSLDLTGLPPTPEWVDAFEADSAPGAYERWVDRLMSTPQYGERMANGWLDLVRFADTVGYHSDNPRNIWPYRDYVIRSFNNNKPFDQFTREQLAGDLLPNASMEARVASGFNRLLLTTEEGGAQEKDYESRYLTDRVRAVGTVWMGQTIGCAQCHDHKFDPITARDFYSMGAFFADVKEAIIGRREDGMLVPTEPQAGELARRTTEAQRLKERFEGPYPELEGAFGRWRQERLDALRSDSLWTAVAPASADSTGGATVTIRDDRSVLIGGKSLDTDSTVVRFTSLPERVVGVRVDVLPDKSLPSQGPGRAGNGNFVLTEVVARVVREGTPARIVAFDSVWASHEQTVSADKNPYGKWSAASVIDQDARGTFAGWAILPEAGKPAQLRLRLKEPLSLASGERLEIELQQKHGHGNHTLGCFRIGMATDAAAVVPPTVPLPNADLAERLKVDPAARTPEQSAKLWSEFKAAAPQLADLRTQRAAADKARADFEGTLPRTLITERSEKPRTVRVLPRGNWLIETGEIMEPAIPSHFRPTAQAASDRRLNRLDLANWLVSPENPLTARVVVNRYWRQFFGTGLSKVIDDFGAQGEPPRYPELLDWLAAEFRESGWDVKNLVRLMVTSRTYRQSSSAPREFLARDPDNRDLARQGRWRIEAEQVRDSALQVSGLLVPRIGGPSVRPYQPDGYWENLNFPQRGYDASSGGDQYRRGLYTWWQRSYVHPSMLAFDAATREECAAERNRSNIPQQALVLLNDPSYVEAARSFAARILREKLWRRRGTTHLGLASGALPRSTRLRGRAASPARIPADCLRQGPGGGFEIHPDRQGSDASRLGSRSMGSLDRCGPCPPQPSRDHHPFLTMSPSTEIRQFLQQQQTRRLFLGRASQGLGALALGSILQPRILEAASAARTVSGAVAPLHFPAKARRVIWLSMAGGPSHLETFDPKPKLAEMHGKPMPESFTKGKQIAQLQGQKLVCYGPQLPFKRFGKAGVELCDLFTQLGSVSDEICWVRSMTSEAINHDPAHMFMNTGSQIAGRPSMGSWVTYGLGSEAENLPGFVVLTSLGRGGQNQPIAARQWAPGMLPSRFQGCTCEARAIR